MKTKQQIATSLFETLRTKMAHPHAQSFHSDARLREDLALDSASVLEMLVLLEVEFGIRLPEEAVVGEELKTVRSVVDVLFAAQKSSGVDSFLDSFLDYEEDIKLHCFVSCQSEVLKRCGIDQRVLYFGVWDSEIVVSDESTISYHSDLIRHDFFVDWFLRLFGVKMRDWYRRDLGKEENVQKLVSLVEGRTPGEHVMVMLDMHRLPERANEFNKDPFPHYLMLGCTLDPEFWIMWDPDYRWEGIVQKERVLHALRHPSVRGGYLFSEAGARMPLRQDIIAYYETCMRLDQNPLTEAIRRVVSEHLSGVDSKGAPLPLSHLSEAVAEVPILAIRKYAYEHGLAFFFRELRLGEEEFEVWCEVIADLVKTYKNIQFQGVRLAQTGDQAVAERIFTLLREQDERERSIKRRLHQLYLDWKGRGEKRELGHALQGGAR
jgi:acyl carrier protein